MALGCRGLAFLDPGSPPWWGRSPLPTRRAFADGAVPSGSREQRCCTLGPRGWSNGLNRSDGSLRAARTEGPGVPTAIFAPQSLTETGAHWVLHSFTQQTLPARLPRPGTHGATRTGSPRSPSSCVCCLVGRVSIEQETTGLGDDVSGEPHWGDTPPCIGAIAA